MQEQPHCQGPEEKLGNGGEAEGEGGGRAEGEREERGELLSRSGAGRGENYREENKPRAAEKEIRHEAGQARRGRGPRSGPGASIVFPADLIRDERIAVLPRSKGLPHAAARNGPARWPRWGTRKHRLPEVCRLPHERPA